MDFFKTIIESFYSIVRVFRIADLIDIILISYLMYKGIKLVRETRAQQLVKGILLLAISNLIATQFGLLTMSFILEKVFEIGIIALVILFQPELRRALEKVGRAKVPDFSLFSTDSPDRKANVWGKVIDKLCNAIFTLSDNKTGALIVIEQKTKLGEQIDTGVTLNAAISEELIGNIFFVNTPLHDGAVIIRDGRILAAACFLPKPQKEEHIASHLGSRHRAAIGISEISDAITIVVSEETGTVSITQEGELKRNFNKQSLKKFLTDNLIHKTNSEETLKLPSFWKKKSKKD